MPILEKVFIPLCSMNRKAILNNYPMDILISAGVFCTLKACGKRLFSCFFAKVQKEGKMRQNVLFEHATNGWLRG